MFKLQEKDLHEIMSLVRTLGTGPERASVKVSSMPDSLLVLLPTPGGYGSYPLPAG